MMKRLFNAVGKRTRDARFQVKALKKVEQIEKGEKILAPKVSTEEKRFHQSQNDELKELINRKDTALIDNMNKIRIKSTEPEARWSSSKDMPTRESEWLHRNDPVWEYGFYEPKEEQIPKNKLMFREALEILRARQEFDEEQEASTTAKFRESARTFYENHKAVARVDKEMLDDMWEYFRPFVRREQQHVVSKLELEKLQKKLHGIPDEQQSLPDMAKIAFRKIFSRSKEALTQYDKMEESEQKLLQEAFAEQRKIEEDRLASRLQSLKQIEEESQNTAVKPETKQEITKK